MSKEEDFLRWGSYQNFLRSDEWSRTRFEVLNEAKQRCQYCCEDRAVEVHHTSYDHGWLNKKYLLALCRDCHEYAHIDEGKRKDRLNVYASGYRKYDLWKQEYEKEQIKEAEDEEEKRWVVWINEDFPSLSYLLEREDHDG